MRLSSLGGEYVSWFRSLTRKYRGNSFYQFYGGILAFLFSQLCLVLAFFLPLKVIIMVGTDGVPYYLRTFVNESNKNDFITALAILAICFFILFLLAEVALGRLCNLAATNALARSKKITLFEQQSEFAADVFVKVVRGWGTALMVVVGFLLGFILEWRIFLVVTVAIGFEFLMLSSFWSYCQRPENVQLRTSFINNRQLLLNIVSAVNFFIGFSVLFYLFLIDAVVNMIIGILMILLLRQVFQRMTIAINDAVYLTKNRAKITGIFFTHSHYEQNKNYVALTFDELLKPEQRFKLFNNFDFEEQYLNELEWTWFDSAEKGTAFYSARSDVNDIQYWLKLYPANKEGAFEQARLTYRALSSNNVESAPAFLDEGFKSGIYYILLSSLPKVELDARLRKKAMDEWFFELWKLPPPLLISGIMERSLPPLSKRLKYTNLLMLMLATNDSQEQREVEKLLSLESIIVNFIETTPKYFRNYDLTELNSAYSSGGGFILLHWNRVSVEPICSNIKLKQLGKAFKPKEIATRLAVLRPDCAAITEYDIEKIVYLSELDQLLTKRHYRAAFELVSRIIRLFEEK